MTATKHFPRRAKCWRVVIISETDGTITEDMTYKQANYTASSILAGIADDSNDQKIIGVYVVAVDNSVERKTNCKDMGISKI